MGAKGEASEPTPGSDASPQARAGDRCCVCGRGAQHDHHLTGRGPDGNQLHDALTVPTCRQDHDLIHEDLRQQRCDAPPKGALSVFETVERCLRRAALLVGRIAEARPGDFWVALAEAAGRLADQLAGAVASLDRHVKGWRVLPHMTT